MKARKSFIYALLIIVGLVVLHRHGRWMWNPIWLKIAGKRTTVDIIERYGPQAEERLRPFFEKAGSVYPPERITLLAFKQERLVELWVEQKGKWTKANEYPFTGFSGKIGPKLKQGDFQIPEGLYKIDFLNPNSSYHLSMRVNYPNDFDRKIAVEEGRTNLGGDIFIHGKSVTIGCIPVGDRAIEELFCLVATIGKEQVEVIISPCDFRHSRLEITPEKDWVTNLYQEIELQLMNFEQPLKL